MEMVRALQHMTAMVKLRQAGDEKGDLSAVSTFLMAHSINRKADNHDLQQGNF